ncbi:MAG: prepilin-type N-terminal cleavage/methylation domain-containing protein, partial [Phycisphaeraceae bacterium]
MHRSRRTAMRRGLTFLEVVVALVLLTGLAVVVLG